MAKLRLLIFSPFFPPHVGGLEGYVSDLNEQLLQSGRVEALTVFTPQLPVEAASREDRLGRYRVVRYPAFELIPNFPVPKVWSRAFWRAFRACEPREHDVLVSHTRFFLSSALALACARALRRPLLHVEHGSDYVQLAGRGPRAAARMYDMTLGRLLLRHADGVVAVSQAAADFVRRLAGRDAQVIYRGMRLDSLEAVAPDAAVLEWAAGRELVVFVGRLIDGKGVADLLHAFAKLDDRGAVMCIIGDGPRRTALEALCAELALSDRVLFEGYLPEQRAWEVLCTSDIVVNPSYTEGLPTSVLEAALLGKALIATDVGGTREIVTDRRGGLLIGPRDVDGLSARLAELLGDRELRERLGAGARAEAAGRFDWSVCAERFTAAIQDLLAARSGARAQPAGAGAAESTPSNTDS